VQLVPVTLRVESQHLDTATVGEALDALDGGGTAGPARAEQAEDLLLGDLEGDVHDSGP
jgi:hypothetical protein